MASWEAENFAEYILIHYRWIVVITVLLPLSLLWKIWSTIRNYIVFKINSAPKMHERKVRDVQNQVTNWLKSGRTTKLCTARPTWQNMSFRRSLYKKSFTNIHVNLVDIVEVDTDNMIVRCEPLVTMGQISRTLEPLGLALAVVPELDQLTVGGLVMGTGVETSSHIHGLFQHVCLEYELVMADGSVVKCNKDENSELFYVVPWSYGTLGFLTSASIKIVPAKRLNRTGHSLVIASQTTSAKIRRHGLPLGTMESLKKVFGIENSTKYTFMAFIPCGVAIDTSNNVNFLHRTGDEFIRLEYHPCTNLPDLVKKFGEESQKKNAHQFVEAILYSLDSGVLMLGDMVDNVGRDGKYNPIGKWSSVWFFKQVEKYLTLYRSGKRAAAVEYIPLRDYYHRHTRSFFWELQDIIPFGNNILFRHALGWLMPPEVSLLKLTQPEAVGKLYERSHVIQDMLVPIETMTKALEVFHKEFEVYPIWLCPFKVTNNPGQLKITQGLDSQMFVDIGVYGVPKANNFETVPSTRRVEEFVIKNKGFQMLYADTYTTKDEFRMMFDHTLYDKVRDSLPFCKDAFPEIYGKVNRSVRK